MPNIAKKFMIGNTTVEIATDYCENKIEEDVKRILDKITLDALASFRAEADKKSLQK